MKISESTVYPYPLLAPWSEDIAGARFEMDLNYREDSASPQLSIHCSAVLDQPEIVRLIDEGVVAFGCFIKCTETGFRRLQQLGFPQSTHHFAPGALLGRVYFRPMVWALKPINRYLPNGAHNEFNECAIQPGQILALGDEQVIDVTRPPLPSIESIFDIDFSTDIPEGEFEVDTGGDRIVVRMGEKTFELVQALRHTDDASRQVAMTSLYVPVVMTVLDQLSGGASQFDALRWHNPFCTRCDQLDIDLKDPDLLNDALKLLGQPFGLLKTLVGEMESADE